MKRVLFVLAMYLVSTACGTTTVSRDTTDTMRVTGIVDVLAAGTRSETVIITDESTGEVFALVGEKAFDIVPEYGQLTVVTGKLTDEGFSVRDDLRKIYVTDYAIVDEDRGDY